MAHTTLQSFNVFLTERLTAAAVEIYGFVEKTVIEYQEEAYRAKLESQRLQRLLDLVFKPEIKLHRADSRQIDLPTTTQEVCVQEKQIQEGCIPTEVKDEPVILPIKEEVTEPWTRPMQTPVHSPCSSVTDTLTQIVTVGEHEEDDMSDNLMQVVTVGEHDEYEASDSITQMPNSQLHRYLWRRFSLKSRTGSRVCARRSPDPPRLKRSRRSRKRNCGSTGATSNLQQRTAMMGTP
ncbi:uncharacterized protein LOC143332740 isoform X3 [Chaetodon auriga]|uniref:uncharacterized protein LOC143332740 isoform X3 n=1 Tax=Chaetodon auriga TaxID=39042 RepID=UPI004032DCE3